MRFLKIWAVVVLAWHSVLAEVRSNPPTAQTVSFRSRSSTLHGFLFKPRGSGPFPAVVWNHGSPKPLLDSGPVSRFDDMASLYVDHGYVLFIPDRRARAMGFKDGETGSAEEQETASVAVQLVNEGLEQNHSDLQAAISWLKSQPFVDKRKMVMSGYSSGAVQAMYEAGRSGDSEMKAFVLFTPGSTQWNKSPFMRKMLLRSLKDSASPCFFIQAQNDYSFDAIAALGKEASAKGGLNKSIVYPPHGTTQKEGNLLVLTGCQVWGDDVMTFLQDALKN